MTLGAVLQATGLVEITLPPWLLAAGYMALGWYVGLGFDREVTRTRYAPSRACCWRRWR